MGRDISCISRSLLPMYFLMLIGSCVWRVCARVSAGCWRGRLLLASVLLYCSTSIAQFNIHTWTTENGLPQNTVIDLCRSPDGYLWLATRDGLVRFDGVRFAIFNRSNTAGIQGNLFNSLYCSPTGEVWAATDATGITHYSHGVFKTYTSKQGLRSNQNVKLTGDSAGHVWVLAQGQIERWNPASSQFSQDANLPGRYISSSDASGAFATVEAGHLLVFSKGTSTSYRLPEDPGWQDPAMEARDVNGTVWIVDAHGRLRHLTHGQGEWSKPVVPSAADRESRTSTYVDPHGQPWRIVVDYQLGGMLAQSLLLPSAGGLITAPFNSLLQDSEGSLWLSTNGQGLVRIRKQIVRTLSRQDGLPDGNIYPIFQDHTGDIWIGTWTGGLARYHDGKVATFPLPGGRNASRITSIGEDRDGVLWVDTYNGLYRRRDDGFERAPQSAFIPNGFVTVMYQDPEGPLWFGTTAGLMRFQNGKWTFFHHEDGLASDDVRVLVRGRTGELWIAGYGGLSKFVNGRFQRWTVADGLPSDSIRALYQDQEGVLWIGTYDGGLGRLENGHVTRYDVRDGLFDNGVFQILEDKRGYLWMSSNRGIYRVAKKELNLFAQGRLSSISSENYGRAEGMRNEECNGGLSPAGIQTNSGQLWFPTQDGVAVIDPGTVQPNLRAPPVVIESLSVDRVMRPLDQAVRILPGQNNVEIAYTAPTLTHADGIHFKYRLTGLDKDWVNASTRRTAYYAHLPAGEYDFTVIAGGDGTWNSEGAKVHVSVIPRFYETRWFMGLIAALVGSSVVLLWRFRTLQFERATARQQAISGQLIALQERERKRIAAELHDGLGQRLLLIKNWAGLAMREESTSGGQQPLVEISEAASEALREVREISYDLRPVQLERLGLTTAIEDLVQQVAASSDIDFKARIADLDGTFPPEAEMSIYRICQESLNNIIRHSQATVARMYLDRNGDRVDIVIEDNGQGFAPAQNRGPEPGGSGGFGLLGIAERVRMLGGRLSVTSSPGSGTVIGISLNSQRRPL